VGGAVVVVVVHRRDKRRVKKRETALAIGLLASDDRSRCVLKWNIRPPSVSEFLYLIIGEDEGEGGDLLLGTFHLITPVMSCPYPVTTILLLPHDER
jgi:hypothetical protein